MNGYSSLLEEVDRLCLRLSEFYKDHLVCCPGCTSCCSCDLSVFEVEASTIKAALRALPPELQRRIGNLAREVQRCAARGKEVSCPCLVDDRCAIYMARPIICRTQGLPLLYEIEDGSREVDFCPLNFSASGAVEKLAEDHLIPLDRMNLELASANIEYCRSQGLEITKSGVRTRMSDLILSLDQCKA